MVKIEKVLLPTDFSENAVYALEYALDLAKRFGARIYILHVVDETIDIAGFYVPHISVEKIEKEMLEVAKKMTDEFCKKYLGGFKDYEAINVVGLPHMEILKAADEKGIDVIVMGSHGRTGINRVFFGNVAEKVIKTASCPVLTVKLPGK